MPRRLLLLVILLMGCLSLRAQQPDSAVQQTQPQRYRTRFYTDTSRNSTGAMMDSVARSLANRQKFVEDSVAMQYVGYPDSNRVNQLSKYIMDTQLYKGRNFLDIPMRNTNIQRVGSSRHQREQWTIIVVISLVVYMAILNLFMNKEMDVILRSFYSKNAAQAGKEEGLLNSQAFVALFLLFGLTSGLFIYQVSAAYDKLYSISGFQLFISLSVIIITLFALKLLVLRFIGFVFKVNKIVTDYIGILYLTYFNIAFVFLPLTLCFCLLPDRFSHLIVILGIAVIIVVFVWQYLRSSVNIISSFRFHKFYLFIYLCALEICPVLILVKALNI